MPRGNRSMPLAPSSGLGGSPTASPVQCRRHKRPHDNQAGEFAMNLASAQNFVDGGWRPAINVQTLPIYEPATGQTYGVIADSTAEDVDLAVRAARKAFDSGAWGRTTALER